MADPLKPESNTDDALLKRIREFTDAAISNENENRTAAVSDLEFLNSDQWDAQDRAQRQAQGKPCLTFNRLTTFLRQVTNDQRQNQVGIKVHPVGGGADVKTAEIYQGMIRHIENNSNAETAYDTAVNSAAAVGFGFFALTTEYESPTSFDQVIKFRRIRDALKVYFDPASVEADGSDAKQCVIVTDIPRAEFDRMYPHAVDKNQAASTALGSLAVSGWVDTNMVRVVEYYYFHYEKKTLYLLTDGTTTTIQPAVEGMVRTTRQTQIPQLKWVKASLGAILEKTDIMCQWIPVFPVWGIEIDIKGKVSRKGIIRDAKDPAKMYNYWMTCATEEVSLRSKTPWIMAEGQDEGYEKQWKNANRVNFAVLKYKPVTVDGVIAPPPQRQPMADVPVGMLQMAVHASDNIKAVTGLFDSSLGARGTATSGIQEREQQRQGDMANFHYIDNLHRAIKHAGRCLVDMIPHYYDAARVVEIMRENGDVEAVEINKPVVDPTEGVEKVLNDITVGRYSVTFDSGPSYATAREEIKENMIELGKAWPKVLEVAGDIMVDSMDWPQSDKVAARLKATLPPQLAQAGEEDENGQPSGPPPLPPEIEQHIQQADQLIDQLQQQLQEAQAGIEKARIDAANRIEIAKINAESAANVAEINAGALMDKEELISLRAQLAHHHRLVEQEQKADHQADAVDQQAEHTAEQSRLAASQAAAQAQSGPTDGKSGS